MTQQLHESSSVAVVEGAMRCERHGDVVVGLGAPGGWRLRAHCDAAQEAIAAAREGEQMKGASST
jgi:hypothetical protein